MKQKSRQIVARFSLLLLVPVLLLMSACGPSATTPTDAAASNSASDAKAAAEAVGELAESNAMLGALNAFYATLTDDQITQMNFPLESELRSNWSNLPAGILEFDRNGIRTGDLDEEQLAALFGFLEAALSAEGYAKVTQIVRADEILGQSSSRGDRFGWTEDNFWLAIFGTPSEADGWAWQFGGHHLAVNVTVKGEEMSLTPTFLGVEPAIYDDNGEMFAPLQEELDGGLAMIAALDAEQQAEAIVDDRPEEVYAGAGNDGVVPPTEGSNVSTWAEDQQAMLWELTNLWIGLLPADAAAVKLAEAQADLGETYFAWNGAVDGTGSIYYRIQGPSLLIEFSIQGNLGDDAGHYHSVYRDTTREYGADLIK